MDQVDIRVRPLGNGWVVEGDGRTEPLLFARGGAAERAADDIARGWTRAGLDVRVLIMDRSDQLAGARRYWGDPAEERRAEAQIA